MAANPDSDDGDSATDLDIYLPAGITPSVGASRFEQLRGFLFDHCREPPK